ncbi:unnamed protein product [Allacma fusca]|uniref:Uncharacterized protein n=1 Tax=Allacma fusca TaxID=39272 RepID=A0A8J2KZH2_9HEXA|nr:unnamed protein product [Allacma fusca]
MPPTHPRRAPRAKGVPPAAGRRYRRFNRPAPPGVARRGRVGGVMLGLYEPYLHPISSCWEFLLPQISSLLNSLPQEQLKLSPNQLSNRRLSKLEPLTGTNVESGRVPTFSTITERGCPTMSVISLLNSGIPGQNYTVCNQYVPWS